MKSNNMLLLFYFLVLSSIETLSYSSDKSSDSAAPCININHFAYKNKKYKFFYQIVIKFKPTNVLD